MVDYATMTDKNQAAPSVLSAAPSATHPAGCNTFRYFQDGTPNTDYR
jgi:hypothetical protein